MVITMVIAAETGAAAAPAVGDVSWAQVPNAPPGSPNRVTLRGSPPKAAALCRIRRSPACCGVVVATGVLGEAAAVQPDHHRQPPPGGHGTGAVAFRWRQSSAVLAGLESAGLAFCGQRGAVRVPSLAPFHAWTGRGGCRRSAPIGGAA
nr:hypothetical protein [Nonomuraea sp. SBT364]